MTRAQLGARVRTGNPGKVVEDLGRSLATTRNWKTIERLLHCYGAQSASA
jgi:hypothetical protein